MNATKIFSFLQILLVKLRHKNYAHRVSESRSLLPAGDDDHVVVELDDAAAQADLDAFVDASVHVLGPVGVLRRWRNIDRIY